ncbi:hypothetical protein OROMI_008989 [Orobanche minor]
MRKVRVSGGPVEEFAKLIVAGACRGDPSELAATAAAATSSPRRLLLEAASPPRSFYGSPVTYSCTAVWRLDGSRIMVDKPTVVFRDYDNSFELIMVVSVEWEFPKGNKLNSFSPSIVKMANETPAAVIKKCKYTIAVLSDPAAALSTSSNISTSKGGNFLEAPVSGSKKPAEDGSTCNSCWWRKKVGNGAKMKLLSST